MSCFYIETNKLYILIKRGIYCENNIRFIELEKANSMVRVRYLVNGIDEAIKFR